jgi:hypothetical protein
MSMKRKRKILLRNSGGWHEKDSSYSFINSTGYFAGACSCGSVLIFNSSTTQPCCPFFEDSQSYNQSERGFGRGFGMMGRGMMGAMNVFVDSEYEFLVHMIPHHEEAVATATYLKENTEREEIREFAEGIIRTQSAEIEQMTTWLENWYPDQKAQC